MQIGGCVGFVRSLWLPALVALSIGGCEDKPAREAEVELSGRVFAAETGKPLSKVRLETPGGAQVTSSADGKFKLRYGSKRERALLASASDAAPLRKPAPKAGGYVELYVKRFDAQQEVDTTKGGAARSSEGARLKVAGDALQRKGAGGAPSKARLSVAAPQPKRPTDLPAIPGNFDARQGDKRGKLSTESPLYAGAHEGEDELELKRGEKASIDLPVRTKGQKGIGATRPLFRYDEAEDLWVEAGTVEETTDEAGLPVYRGEIGALGWWAVGEFYDRLSCVHGCVEDASDERAAGARVVVTGIDFDSQLTTYADADGCYALDLPAGARISVAAQTEERFAGPALFTASSEPGSVQDGLEACRALDVLRLGSSEATSCPLGLSDCGDVCVDTNLDPDHCGACGQACEGSLCAAGLCENEREPVDAEQDAGNGTVDAGSADAGAEQPDAAPAEVLLSVVTEGPGTVSSRPDGILCGDVCDAWFPFGAEVVLEATQDASSTFVGWSGDCAASPEPSCTLTLDGTRAAAAIFMPRSLPVDVLVDGSGAGTVLGARSGITVVDCGQSLQDCSESAPYGSVISFTAQPDPYSVFSGWGGACAGVQGTTCTLPITEATNVSATFAMVQYRLTVRVIATVSPPGDGTVTSSPPGISCTNDTASEVVCSADFAAGSVIQLTATPDDDVYYGFIGWGGACSGTDTNCNVTLNSDLDVSADFFAVIF